MNIAFFTSHVKTKLFFSLAKRLESSGHNIYWISTSSTWTKWLINKGVSKAKILDLTSFGYEWSKKISLTPDEEHELSKIENISGLTINNIILMDRLLRLKLHTYARSFLYVAQREIKRFLVEKQVKSLFLEVTWAVELLTIMICKEIGCSSYCPQHIRIPGDRFAFFKGHLQSEIAFLRDPNEYDTDEANRFYDYFLKKKPRPSYMYANTKLPKFYFNWFRKLLSHLQLKREDPFDETRPSVGTLVQARLREVWNRGRISLSKPFERIHLSGSKPYVLFTLHHQPEASIDVLGSYFSNQIELIRTLSRSLPSTHDLYVKEHRVSIGARSIEFYKNLKRIPGVRLIDPFTDNHELILNADLVITVSGTAAYEAALYNKPAMTITPMFFGAIQIVNGINIYQDGLHKIFQVLNSQIQEKEIIVRRQNNITFLAWVIAQSFKGLISDPIHNPACMEPENLDAVADAINLLLRNQTERRPHYVV